MREAPAIPLIEALLAAGATVQAYDPEAQGGQEASSATRHLRRRNYARLKGADGSPSSPSGTSSGARLRAHAVADEDAGRLRRPQSVHAGADEADGFTYYSIGRR
jgi:hypothetical protein